MDTVKDDIGNEWVFGLDAPKTFASAVQASVRRWRLKRIAKLFPQLVPNTPDVHTDPSTPTLLIDMFGVVAPLAKGKAAATKMTSRWNNAWAGYLASAMNGGQWSQTRKAKVAIWNIADSRCQLCTAAPQRPTRDAASHRQKRQALLTQDSAMKDWSFLNSER